jgi:hypothetical protein
MHARHITLTFGDNTNAIESSKFTGQQQYGRAEQYQNSQISNQMP